MALFKLREEYLETRILDYNPNVEDSQSIRRQRIKCRVQEGRMALKDEDFTLKLMRNLYKEIDDTSNYALIATELRVHVKKHTKCMLEELFT